MDTDLVTRAQRGDQEAFADLVYAVADRFLAVSHRILGDIDLAEDATQRSDIDVLYDPSLNSGGPFLAIASQPIGDATAEDWVAAQMSSEEGCSALMAVTIDGFTGQIGRYDCSVAVVTAAGRGYWFQLYTGSEAPHAYDHAWFEEVLATVQLYPEDAAD